MKASFERVKASKPHDSVCYKEPLDGFRLFHAITISYPLGVDVLAVLPIMIIPSHAVSFTDCDQR